MEVLVPNRVDLEGRISCVTPRTAIVVPTLGKRPEFLYECLASIQSSRNVHVRLVAPAGIEFSSSIREMYTDVVVEPGGGLARAINAGLKGLPESILYVNWLGDDDQLRPGAIQRFEQALDDDRDVAVVFGGCNYIDETGSVLFTNSSGQWAVRLLSFGPQLISQPALLCRRSVFEELGGLDESLQFAFDLDLLLRAKKHARIQYVRAVTASYRWHQNSLTVGSRRKSVMEASSVRRQHLSRAISWAGFLWEPLVRNAIFLAGGLVTLLMSRGISNRQEKSI